MNEGCDPYEACISNLLRFFFTVENSTFKIILWILANRLSLTYSPSQQAKYLQEPGVESAKCEQEVSFKGEVILIAKGQRTGFFLQEQPKARLCARPLACYCLIQQWDRTRLRTGKLPHKELPKVYSPVQSVSPACFPELIPTFLSRLILNVTTSK